MGKSYKHKWCVIGDSVRGNSHIRTGLPNQDAIHWLPESGAGLPLVLAVSDGHGSRKCFRSDRGARLAVEAGTEVVGELLANQSSPSIVKRWSEKKLPEEIVKRWRGFVADDLADTPFTKRELEQLESEVELGKRRRVVLEPLIAYGATLMTVAVTGSFVLYLQIGDGDILTVSEAGRVSQPRLPGDERLFADETTSLCASNAWRDFRACLQVTTDSLPALILVSTDGYSNSFRDEDEFLKVGGDILDNVRSDGLERVSKEMEGWLRDASREGSGDDITLGIICRVEAVNGPLPRGRVPKDHTLQSQQESPAEVSPDGRTGDERHFEG
jgi:hypothetical protein